VDETRLPDPARLREYPLDLFRVRKGEVHFIKTLTSQYGGCFGHFVRGRTRYCPGSHCDCKHKREERLWYGFAAVVRWDGLRKLWLPAVLQVTQALDHDFHGQYRRGQVWEVSKREADATKQAYPVTGRLIEVLDESQVPPFFPVKTVVLRVFNVHEADLTYANPMPKQPRVEVPQAPPPGPLQERSATPVTDEQRQQLRQRMTDFGRMPSENGHGKKGGGA
jgi:hypothetical protein